MTLHIGIDGVENAGKTTLAKRLTDFFTNKNYRCKLIPALNNAEIIDILTTYPLHSHESALLKAFDRSFTYYTVDWKEYDLVFWDTTILQDYVENTDKKTNTLFIKQINKYYPQMNLTILIQTNNSQINNDTNTADTIAKYQRMQTKFKNVHSIEYKKNKKKKMTEDAVKLLFQELPTCNWCGRLFTKNSNNKKYCSKKCKDASLEEQYRINNRNYYHRYKDVMTERQKGGLGSKGANLHSKADLNPIRELAKVRRGKRALGLKPIGE